MEDKENLLLLQHILSKALAGILPEGKGIVVRAEVSHKEKDKKETIPFMVYREGNEVKINEQPECELKDGTIVKIGI